MTRHADTVLTALALTAAAPALAHGGDLPPMPPLPHIGPNDGYDRHPDELDREGWHEDCRAEYSDEYSEDEAFGGCEPYRPPYGMGYHHGGPGPAYHYRHGYRGYAVPVIMVPVKIETRYVYSEPLRREKEVVVEEWVEDEVVERKAVSRPREASKAVPTASGKTTRPK